MVGEDEFLKHITAGRPTSYDTDVHIRLLYKVFTTGGDVMSFCADAMIGKKTFYDWLKKHQEFKEAYDIMVNYAGAKWELYPLNPKIKIEFPYWSMIMRNRFGYGKSKFKIAETKNAKEMMQAAKEHLDEDQITINDYTAIANSAKTQAIIDGECSDDEKLYRPSTIEDRQRARQREREEIDIRLKEIEENEKKASDTGTKSPD
jgi:hypothetical protein